jgi:hypothetical protein
MNTLTESLASTLAGVNETYRGQGVVVPFCLSRNTLTESLANTLVKEKEIYRRQGVVIPSCLSRNPLTKPLLAHCSIKQILQRV